MEKRLTIRMPEALHLRLTALAERTDMGLAETGRTLIERGLSAPAGAADDAQETADLLSALLIAQDEQRAKIDATGAALVGINDTLRDLALAVQKLYLPAPAAGTKTAQSAPVAAPGSLQVATPKPPAYTVWAASQPWQGDETREERIARLKAEYKNEFGVSP